MISGAQVRAARGLLNWTPRELARRAIVSDATVYALESASGKPANVNAMAAVQRALEAAGIEFLDDAAPGVRFHPERQSAPSAA
jgi:transcriptional regulator with XRE-family HTH domain